MRMKVTVLIVSRSVLHSISVASLHMAYDDNDCKGSKSRARDVQKKD